MMKTRKHNRLPRSLRHEFRMSGDGDAWGRCLGWLFAVADYMEHRNIPVPGEWHFRQSPFGPNREAWEWKILTQRNDSAGTIERLGNVLFRLRNILEAQGRDY